jgi:hypothetical protein
MSPQIEVCFLREKKRLVGLISAPLGPSLQGSPALANGGKFSRCANAKWSTQSGMELDRMADEM